MLFGVLVLTLHSKLVAFVHTLTILLRTDFTFLWHFTIWPIIHAIKLNFIQLMWKTFFQTIIVILIHVVCSSWHSITIGLNWKQSVGRFGYWCTWSMTMTSYNNVYASANMVKSMYTKSRENPFGCIHLPQLDSIFRNQIRFTNLFVTSISSGSMKICTNEMKSSISNEIGWKWTWTQSVISKQVFSTHENQEKLTFPENSSMPIN